MTRAALPGMLLALLSAQEFPFRVDTTQETVAAIELSAPGRDWSVPGREAALAAIHVDGNSRGQLMVTGERRVYEVLLGRLQAGSHTLAVRPVEAGPAAGLQLSVHGVRLRDGGLVAAHAPILVARANTIGRFTDIPLLAYAERLRDSPGEVLQYSVLFSNEDGGTPTPALMARWGRPTDIEYVYRVRFNASGQVESRIIQGRGHREEPFAGPFEADHPLLEVVTDNNMVAPAAGGGSRFWLAPLEVHMSGHSREQIMDDHPFTWRLSAQELMREGKLRPFGAVDGRRIGDPRTYLYVEFLVRHSGGRSAVMVRRRGESLWRSSHLGIADLAIERDGWVRSAVELPAGTRPQDLAEIGFTCLAAERKPAGTCRLEAVRKVFFLDGEYRPGRPFWSLDSAQEIRTGETFTWTFASQ